MERLPFQFRAVDEHYYEVSLFGHTLGHVYRDSNAWSYGRWMIEGDRQRRETVGHREKLRGHRTRQHAAHQLAIMSSAALTAAHQSSDDK